MNESIPNEHRILGAVMYHLLKVFLGLPLRFIWIKKILGKKNLPLRGPFIVAANHQSYFDFLSMIAVLPFRLTFPAAEKFFSSKFWRPFVEYTGQIRVDRKAKDKTEVITKSLEVLKQGKILAIFPQGTRSRNGRIEKTYTGVAKLALKARVPVIPVGIRGAFEVLPPQNKWPKLKKGIELSIGKPLNFNNFYQAADDYQIQREVTDKVMREIAKLAKLDFKNA